MNLEKLGEVLATEPKFRIKQAKEAAFKKFISGWNEATFFPLELRENYIKSAKILPYQKDKEYYNPNYAKEQLQRIPDYRYQLLWSPQVIMDQKENNLSFYSSDLDGVFEINLEGFSKEGKPISISKTFEVR